MIALRRYENQTVSVDGCHFEFCVFENCTMFCAGTEDCHFDNCDFISCNFIGNWPEELLDAVCKGGDNINGRFK